MGRHCSPPIPVQLTVCPYCKRQGFTVVEDECHFILFCPLYNDHRLNFIPQRFRVHPTKEKCFSLLACKNEVVQYKLSVFVHKAFNTRTSFVQQT